jgi:hypothetical protein
MVNRWQTDIHTNDRKTALASREKELVGHGTANHAEGFGSPSETEGINLASKT